MGLLATLPRQLAAGGSSAMSPPLLCTEFIGHGISKAWSATWAFRGSSDCLDEETLRLSGFGCKEVCLALMRFLLFR